MNVAMQRQLIALITRVVREETPEKYRGLLVISNKSGHGYVCMDIRLGGNILIYLNMSGPKLDIAAGNKVQPFRGAGGKLFVDKIEQALLNNVRRRLPQLIDHYELNLPLESIRGVSVDRQHDGGITLRLEGLSEGGYRRMVAELEPLMNLSRFQREEPV